MTEYRLYCVDPSGEGIQERLLGATDDADAIGQVEIMQLQSECELWARERLIVALPARG